MADDMKGKKLRAVVDLGALGVEAGAEFTVTKKMTERADFEVLLEIGAVEAVRQAKAAGPAKPAPPTKTEAGGSSGR